MRNQLKYFLKKNIDFYFHTSIIKYFITIQSLPIQYKLWKYEYLESLNLIKYVLKKYKYKIYALHLQIKHLTTSKFENKLYLFLLLY